jgi:hypothetical protein
MTLPVQIILEYCLDIYIQISYIKHIQFIMRSIYQRCENQQSDKNMRVPLPPNTIRNTFIILFILIFNAGCSKDDGTNPIPFNPGPDGFATYSAGHFTFHYTAIDKDNISRIGDDMEKECDRVLNDLKLKNITPIDIRLYPSKSEFSMALFHSNISTTITGMAINKNLIWVISPNYSESGSSQYQSRLITIVHEFTHCACMNIKPISSIPRWLNESIAVYESGRFLNPKSYIYMTNGTPPSLAEMNIGDDIKIYEIGYTVIEFIVNKWGKDTVVDLFISDGDIQSVLKISASEFESGWYEFVKKKYL